MLAVAAIALTAGSYAHVAGGAGGWGFGQRVDSVTDADRLSRQQTFDAIGSIRLAAVQPADVDAATADMHLAPQDRQALAADLATPAPSRALVASPAMNAAPAVAPAAVAVPATAPAALAAAAEARPLRLAWVTLRDTDVEDGDVVRIDSEGYSRTIVLTKRGETFAVPVPADGVIRITGINDGDGGGITVGLASGAAKVVFPIMSVGQSLRLAATVH